MSKKLRIVIGNASLAAYTEGGGHWSCFLQHFHGLLDLGHDVAWLEILRRCGNPEEDERRVRTFFERMEACGFAGRCILFVCDKDDPALPETADVRGMTALEAARVIAEADLLWNLCCAFRQPLLGRFRRRALIDTDPGEIQIAALDYEMGILDHEVLFTVGLNVGFPGCRVPDLDRVWHPFAPIIFLPQWQVAPLPPNAPLTSITQWTWYELWFDNRRLSLAKREAYLAHRDLPQRTGERFQLAANIHPDDKTGDREAMLDGGWELVHPHDCVTTPETYRDYLVASRAEFCAPKPLHRDLLTGWFSDRSAAYLASGRPVLCEDTGFTKFLPEGTGLLAFRDTEEAASAVDRLNADWVKHSRTARKIAEEFFASETVLRPMIEKCG